MTSTDGEAERESGESRAEREHRSLLLTQRATRAEQQLRGVIDSLIDPLVLLAAVRGDDGDIVDFVYIDANEAACAANRRSRDELVGSRLLTLFPEHGPSGLLDRYAQVVESGVPLTMDDEPFVSPFDGVEGRFDNRAVRVGDGISLTWRDVTERFVLRQRLREQADHDLLTGVANRRQLNRRLAEMVQRAPRTGSHVALLYLDLDNFKEVNDQLGHAGGDAVLTEVAASVRGCVRDQDLLARVGGDEFVVVLDGVHGIDDATAVARKLLDALGAPVFVGGHEVRPQASVGVSIVADGEEGAAALLRADAALYEAKNAGRNCVAAASAVA